MSEDEKYWEKKGYNDKLQGKSIADKIWNKNTKEYPKEYHNIYRLGQWKAYEESKIFK